MPNARPSLASTNARIDTLADSVDKTLGLLQQLVGQHSTPAPVAEVAKTEEPAPVQEPSASDKLLAFVAEKGIAFARGGRVELNVDAAKALVRVLKTGTPEIIQVSEVGKLGKRHISHLAIGRSGDGTSVFTQYCYTPEG